MSVRDGDLIADRVAVLQHYRHMAAKRFHFGIAAVIAGGPQRVFDGADLVPKAHRVRPAGALGGIGGLVVPAAVLQGDREDVHDRMIQRFPAGLRVHFLRIIGPGADHIVGVMAGMDDDFAHPGQVADARAQPPRQTDQRLALVLGGMLLGIRLQDRPL